MAKKIRVLIVDDSALIRNIFTEFLQSAPEIEVVGAAVDPIEARSMIKELNPDVLTLDIEMPNMDGISFLQKIMKLRPIPVVMVSTLTQKGATATLKALEYGAVDFVSKPLDRRTKDAMMDLKDELILKVKSASRANVKAIDSSTAKPTKSLPNDAAKSFAVDLIAIGSSTGGVEALREIITVLPRHLPPIAIVQHMPKAFTASFAKRLDDLSSLSVCEAAHQQFLEPGSVYIAPGDKHLKIVRKGEKLQCLLGEGEKVSGHCPSVDVLFNSVATLLGKEALGVILTGMGHDGTDGMKAMHDLGAYTIGQNESSCVVYGMPKSAYEKGAVDIQLPLLSIAKEILSKALR